MADKKISQLSSASALTGAEPLAIVQDGVTKKTTVQDVANLSTLFPNGFKSVPSSRDFDASDVGYILTVQAINIALTMPSVAPFTDGQYFAILNIADGANFNTEFEDDAVFMLGGNGNSETVVLVFSDTQLVPTTGRIYDIDDDKIKTSNKYFFDKINTP